MNSEFCLIQKDLIANDSRFLWSTEPSSRLIKLLTACYPK